MVIRSLFFFLFLLWTSIPAVAEVKVSIDRNPVQVNESFQLVFSLDHTPDHDPDFSPLQQHFLIGGNNRSTSISIINGKYQRSVKWTLQLMAKQVGDYMIPAIRFDKERSEPFEVKVEPSSLSSVPHDQLLLELEADRQSVPVQGQVILKLRLLSGQNLSAYNFGDITIENLDAVLEPLGDVQQFQTRIADQSYLVLEKRFAIFPQQSGVLEIPPVLAEVRMTSGSSFDPFKAGGKIGRARSSALSIEVTPVPADLASSFWLPANKVELSEQWQGDLQALVAGEPITRTLTLIADGLTSAQLPEFELPAVNGVKQYPDQPALQNKRSGKGLVGQRVQKVALIPGAAGSYLLPELAIPWWNVESGKMETAFLPQREIIVVAAETQVTPDAVVRNEAEPLPEAISYNPFWLWMCVFLAFGWAASGVYWWLASTRRDTPDAEQMPDPLPLKKAARQLQQACHDNNADKARVALLAWGKALYAPQAVANLNQLAQLTDPGISLEIDRMNRSLYASVHESWNGDELWQLCRGVGNEADKSGPGEDVLMPLNPTG